MKVTSGICSLLSTGIVPGCALGLFFSARETILNRYIHYRTFRLIFLDLRYELNRWVLLSLLFMAALFLVSLACRPLLRRFAGRSPGSLAARLGGGLTALAGARAARAASLVIVLLIAALNIGLFIDRAVNEPTGPNIVWIYCDAMRSDHLGCYGYQRDTSPSMCNLAGNGVLFKDVISQATSTFPSVHSTLTSKYACYFFPAKRGQLGKPFLTVAEILKNRGYQTAAISSSHVISDSRKFRTMGGFEQGFDIFDTSIYSGEKEPSKSRWRSPERVIKGALEWLQTRRQKKFFLFLYILDPHDDYRCPEPYNSMYDPDYVGKKRIARGHVNYWEKRIYHGMPAPINERDIYHLKALYDGEITYADTQIGKLLNYLRNSELSDGTLVVLTSDHGEEFYEHGCFKHGCTLYNEVLKVPLIFSYPELLPRGKVIKNVLVQSLDIAPTVLDICGIPKPQSMQGQSLLPLIFGESTAWRDYAISESLHVDAKCITTGKWKYIHHFETDLLRKNIIPAFLKGRELFDLEKDPGEKTNLFDREPKIAQSLFRKMMSVMPAFERSRLKEARGIELTQETTDKLKSLGYLQ